MVSIKQRNVKCKVKLMKIIKLSDKPINWSLEIIAHTVWQPEKHCQIINFQLFFFSEFILKKKEGTLGKSFRFFLAINRVYTLDVDCILYYMQVELIVYSFCHFLTEIFGNFNQFSGTSHVNILANELLECQLVNYFSKFLGTIPQWAIFTSL